VLLALLSLFGFLIFTRSTVETTLLRVPGTLFQKSDDGFVSNLYSIEFVNKSNDDMSLKVAVREPEGAVIELAGDKAILVKPGELTKRVCIIKMPMENIKSAKTRIQVAVYSNDELLETVTSSFIGPVKTVRNDEEKKVDKEDIDDK
jgi:hypothetical protein